MEQQAASFEDVGGGRQEGNVDAVPEIVHLPLTRSAVRRMSPGERRDILPRARISLVRDIPSRHSEAAEVW